MNYSKAIYQIQQTVHEGWKISYDIKLMDVFSGLWPRTIFWWLVHKDGPRTYYEFPNQVEKHISIEEAMSGQDDAVMTLISLSWQRRKSQQRIPCPRGGEKWGIMTILKPIHISSMSIITKNHHERNLYAGKGQWGTPQASYLEKGTSGK